LRWKKKHATNDAEENPNMQTFSVEPQRSGKNPRRGLMVAALVMMFTSVLFIGIGGYMSAVSWNLLNNGVKTTGTVVELRAGSDSEGGTTYEPIIEYFYEGQRFEQGTHNSGNPPQFKQGETVTIYLNPERPTQFRVDRFLDLWLIPSVFGCVTVIQLMVIGLLVFLWLRPQTTTI
jgi:hypothetical protein